MHSASKQRAAGLAVGASVGRLQHLGHMVQGSVGVGDNRGVLHVFSCGDGSLFAWFPTKQPEEKSQMRTEAEALGKKSSNMYEPSFY